VGHPLGLIKFEMEDVGDLEVRAIVEDEVAANKNVHVARRRRRKHDFQLVGAGLYSAAQARRKRAADYELLFQAWRQAIALGEAWWKMFVVSVVPAADIAVAIRIAFVVVAVMVTVAMTMVAVVVVMVVPAIVIVAIVFVVAVAIALRDGNRSGKCQAQ
jgi:hypothetical protein